MMFLDCPAYLDQDGAVRCGLPAEVRCRFTMRSTDGPIESAMISCPAGHYFCGAIESLTWEGKDKHDPGSAAVTSRSGRDSVQGSNDGRDGTDGFAVRRRSVHDLEADRRRRLRLGTMDPVPAAISGRPMVAGPSPFGALTAGMAIARARVLEQYAARLARSPLSG